MQSLVEQVSRPPETFSAACEAVAPLGRASELGA